MTFLKTITLAGLVAASLGGAAAASAEIDTATQDKIRTQLTAEGYDVRKIDSEDGMIEVYAIKDGKKLELYLDAALKIVQVKEAD